jgi:glutaredoxin
MTEEFLRKIMKFVFTILFVFSSYSLITAQGQPSIPILFSGDGCPHCDDVKEEIDNDPVLRDIEIDHREIYYNEANSKVFSEKVQECGLSPYQAGVPMLYYNGNCWSGKYGVIQGLEVFLTGETAQDEQVQEPEIGREVEQEVEQDMSIVDTDSITQESSTERGFSLGSLTYVLLFVFTALLVLFLVLLFSNPKEKEVGR